MLDDKTAPSSRDDLAESGAVASDDTVQGDAATAQAASPPFDESITEELAALIDDGKTYAEAELAFQKTRATIAGKSIGIALGLAIVAIILLHIAFLALAVGLVIALQPLVTIWGAIAIVVGGLLLLTGLLGLAALKRGKLVGAMFASDKAGDDEA